MLHQNSGAVKSLNDFVKRIRECRRLNDLNPEHIFQIIIIHGKEGLGNNKVIHNFRTERIKTQFSS